MNATGKHQTGPRHIAEILPEALQHYEKLFGPKCTHPETTLLRLDCGPGGFQFRRYCMSCWRATTSAIPHKIALAELRGREAPLADLEQLHRAQEQAFRKNRELAL